MMKKDEKKSHNSGPARYAHTILLTITSNHIIGMRDIRRSDF